VNTEKKRWLRSNVRRDLHIPQALKTTWDARIARGVWSRLQPRPGMVVGGYAPLDDEPDLNPLWSGIVRRGARLALPIRTARVWQWRLACPAAAQNNPLQLADVVCGAAVRPHAAAVPGVAFDRKGVRLGRGGGVYDRLLPCIPRSRRIGVAYSAQLLNRIPRQSWDQPMAGVVSPMGWHPADRQN